MISSHCHHTTVYKSESTGQQTSDSMYIYLLHQPPPKKKKIGKIKSKYIF